MTDLTKGCEYGPGHYRFLEKDKTQALRKSRGNFDGEVRLSDRAKQDLAWWIVNLSRAQRRIWIEIPKILLTTDACDYGWGAVFESPGKAKEYTNGAWSKNEKEWHINVKETLAVWWGLLSFAKDLHDCAIKCRIDNTTAVAYINHQGGMKNPECDRISRDIWAFCQEKGIWLYATHIAGIDNTEADHESRVRANIEWELPQDTFEILNASLGPFEIDLFAPRLAHKLTRYASWLPDPFAEIFDAFSCDW